MKIERDKHQRIFLTGDDGGLIESRSVEANLLFAILEKLEEIRCGIINVEEAVNPSQVTKKGGRVVLN